MDTRKPLTREITLCYFCFSLPPRLRHYCRTRWEDFLKRILRYLEDIEFLLFRFALLILFIVGLIRLIRGELGW